MKKLSLLAIFLLVSCAEKSELDKCIDANVNLSRTLPDAIPIDKFGVLNEEIVRMDFDAFLALNDDRYYGEIGFKISLAEGVLAGINDGTDEGEWAQDTIESMTNYANLRDVELASESFFNELKESGEVLEEFNIKLDADEVYFTWSDMSEVSEEYKDIKLGTIAEEFTSRLLVPQEQRMVFNKMKDSTIRLADEKILREWAQTTCNLQGIY